MKFWDSWEAGFCNQEVRASRELLGRTLGFLEVGFVAISRGLLGHTARSSGERCAGFPEAWGWTFSVIGVGSGVPWGQALWPSGQDFQAPRSELSEDLGVVPLACM